MKKWIALALTLAMLSTALICAAESSGEELTFILRNGDKNSSRIAITVDDFFEVERGWEILDMCKEYGITMTLFPLGIQLDEKDRDMWQALIDAGCEIATHNYGHVYMGKQPAMTIIQGLGKAQQQLDATLGYHYAVRWMRPPFGNLTDEKGRTNTFRNAVLTFGIEHAVLWNVSETDPGKAVAKVSNGCIMLYHARMKDMQCLRTIIPQILEKGYEPVTLSELFGFDPPETGGELYVFNPDDYRKTGK